MGEGSYFPYILLNEMEMMFSQLAKQSSRVLPAVLCTDAVCCIKNQRYNVNGFEKEQNHGAFLKGKGSIKLVCELSTQERNLIIQMLNSQREGQSIE